MTGQVDPQWQITQLRRQIRPHGLLDKLRSLQTYDRRHARAVQALELAGTTEARETLRAWAEGAAGARLT